MNFVEQTSKLEIITAQEFEEQQAISKTVKFWLFFCILVNVSSIFKIFRCFKFVDYLNEQVIVQYVAGGTQQF